MKSVFTAPVESSRKYASARALPAWFRQPIADADSLGKAHLLCDLRVNTVCRQAKCPNMPDCFGRGEFTFMILGDRCSRHCSFCAVKKLDSSSSGIDMEEPSRVALAVRRLALSYVVITSVTRDDLPDGGAGIFARCVSLIHDIDPNIKVEVLIPDFKGLLAALYSIVQAQPSVVAHNMETVKRLYPALRPQAVYDVSLGILRKIKEIAPGMISKSSLMLGFGETFLEVVETMRDLRENQCDILVLGQYLSPGEDRYPVEEFIAPEQFAKYKEIGLGMGFRAVLSGPKVRSSYQAKELYESAVKQIKLESS